MNVTFVASWGAIFESTGSLTKEAKADNVGVCNVYPGGVDTNFRATANPSYLKPETVAKMIKNCMEVEDGCVHDIVIRPFVEDNIP